MEDKLKALQSVDKFSKKTWQERGLNPSRKELCLALNNEFNQLIENLLNAIHHLRLSDLSDELETGLLRFNSYELDSEEKELIADYFNEISQLVSVNMDTSLDNWLYGLKSLEGIKRAVVSIVKEVDSECSCCKQILKLTVYKERQNVAPFWQIVQCNFCNEFNLLAAPPNVDWFKNGNFFVFETLPQNATSLEEALSKMAFYKNENAWPESC